MSGENFTVVTGVLYFEIPPLINGLILIQCFSTSAKHFCFAYRTFTHPHTVMHSRQLEV